ncbi:putative myb-binding protein 1A-like protein, partial [Apostichopus japonicus]
MKEFWNEVIENGLCLDDSYACVHIFTVLERLLPHCKEKDIPELFSPKIAEFLLDKLAKRKDKGRIRQELVSFTLRLPSLVAAFSTASKQLSVLRCLFSSPAYIHFDAITRTKTLANMISSLNGEGIKMYLEWLKELFFKETESADFAGVRRWICRQMLTLMKNPNVPREEGWMMEAAQFFFLHAFFEVKNQANYPPITGDLREEIAQHFYSAVEILSNSPPFHAEPDLRLHGVAPDGTLRAYKLVNHAKTLLSSDSVECLTPFSEEVQEAWETMISTVDKIHKKYSDSTSATAGLAFQLLFLQVGLQTFREPEQCAEILEDLQLCFEKAMGKKDKLKKKTDEPEWMEVIVEILISLLARSSHLLRTVVEHSFKIICSNLTESSLQLILDMFDPDKQKLMSLLSFDGDEESDGEDEELIEEDAALDEDGEGGENKILNGKKSKTEDVDEDEDSDSSDDDDDDEDEETAPVDAAFRKEVMNALGDAGVLKQQEDDSDSDLNDEAMSAFDDTLADVFRTKKKKNQKFDAKLNEETVVHFKLRAFQLLDIFIKKNPDSPLLIKMVYPLLVIAGTVKGQRDAMILAERAAQLLEIKFFKAKKYPQSISKKDIAYISETLEKLMDLQSK